jgi:Putative regulator of cell autolysis
MKQKKILSLKWELLKVFIICWLLPIVLVLIVLLWYVGGAVNSRAQDTMRSQLDVNLEMCSERLDGAIQASRMLSYDPTIKEAYAVYKNDKNPNAYLMFYLSANNVLNRLYGADNRFAIIVFAFGGELSDKSISNYVEGNFTEIRNYYSEDHEKIVKYAETLGTAIGFFESGGSLFLVRNVVDNQYNPIGTLILSLNMSYYFGNLAGLSWCEDIQITINQERFGIGEDGNMYNAADFVPRNEKKSFFSLIPAGEESIVSALTRPSYYVSAEVYIDYNFLVREASGYKYILMGMIIIIIPLLIYFFRFFRFNISRPVDKLVKGAQAIESGDLGFQMSNDAESSEFRTITDSINHMSIRLRRQFERIFEEQVELRNARIKTLQSHINPHFLNNTLEIINWEARLGNNANVSKMIESLSIVLDAAIARDTKAEISLAEEIGNMNAYLHIVSVRYGKRLEIAEDIDPQTAERMVPRLILQPVIENAIEHGIGPAGSGRVSIRSFLQGADLIIEIENTGSLGKKDISKIEELLSGDYAVSDKNSYNIGISNVNQRLKIMYGESCGLTIRKGEGKAVIARLVVGCSANKQ